MEQTIAIDHELGTSFVSHLVAHQFIYAIIIHIGFILISTVYFSTYPTRHFYRHDRTDQMMDKNPRLNSFLKMLFQKFFSNITYQ